MYAGLVLGLAGGVCLLHPLPILLLPSRRRAAVALGVGVGLVALAALLPAPERRSEPPATRLDEFVSVWQFGEHHEIRIHTSPERVERAVREVTAREIRLFLLLTRLRRPRLGSPGGSGDILAPSPDRPLLEVALDGGFLLLAEEPRREIVFGTLVVVPPEVRRLSRTAAEHPDNWRPERVQELSEPGHAKAVMNFLLADEGDGWTRLTTETRVFATDAATVRRFAVYWRLIYPGSSLIRRMWLAAIRARAEAAPAAETR